MSKIIRTRKPSVLPFYAMALVFLVLCAVLPVYKLWALLAALGGAFVAFGAAHLSEFRLIFYHQKRSCDRVSIWQ